MNLPFRVETEDLDGVRVVSVVGELDQATLPDLQGPLDEAVEANGSLLVDLSDCSFIDSSGLGALVSARERVIDTEGRRFGICCPDAQVQRLLQITGLDKAMGMVTSRREALEALQS
jgi:anti-sigma B factor antagonist